jgi:hypothetical protein
MKKKMISRERTNKIRSDQEISQDGLALLVLDLGRAMKSLLSETLASLEVAVLSIQALLIESSRKQKSFQPVRLEDQRKGERLRERKIKN